MRLDVVVRELQNSLMGAKEADYKTTYLAVRGIAKNFTDSTFTCLMSTMKLPSAPHHNLYSYPNIGRELSTMAMSALPAAEELPNRRTQCLGTGGRDRINYRAAAQDNVSVASKGVFAVSSPLALTGRPQLVALTITTPSATPRNSNEPSDRVVVERDLS
jgi:hypothetical protein